MKYKTLCKRLLKYYPDILPNEEAVLDQLFFVCGNGYEWENGELLGCETLKQMKADYKSFEKQAAKFKAIYRSLGLTQGPPTPTNRINIYPIGRYARIYHIPYDVKSDWLNAAKKAMAWALSYPELTTESDREYLSKVSEHIQQIEAKSKE